MKSKSKKISAALIAATLISQAAYAGGGDRPKPQRPHGTKLSLNQSIPSQHQMDVATGKEQFS